MYDCKCKFNDIKQVLKLKHVLIKATIFVISGKYRCVSTEMTSFSNVLNKSEADTEYCTFGRVILPNTVSYVPIYRMHIAL